MQLRDLNREGTPPIAFTTFDNIPWHEPGFSERMLAEHLSQSHDRASRRDTIIERQVAWIYQTVLGATSRAVLDLGCGPGFYANRLAALGHRVHGIDWSPASIRWARQAAAGARFTEGDLRQAEYGSGFDLAMLLYGEFNVFSHDDAVHILQRCRASLKPAGTLLLEVSSRRALEDVSKSGPRVSWLETGLFLPSPHLLLEESWWETFDGVLTTRYTVIDLEAATGNQYGASYQSYIDTELARLLEQCGFTDMSLLPDMGVDAGFDGFIVKATATAS